MSCAKTEWFIFSVSHTTDDLVFKWDHTMPLDVDSGIELPQLELTNNFTGDCTTAYSTGENIFLTNIRGIWMQFKKNAKSMRIEDHRICR